MHCGLVEGYRYPHQANVVVGRLEVTGIVEIVDDAATEAFKQNGEVIQRRGVLAHLYNTLPDYASQTFWDTIGNADIPLEVLARCVRNCADSEDRNRILQIIVQRTQRSNEFWANTVLAHVSVSADERVALIGDLCADLYECMLRALLDPKRLFWEENFLHCLYFERKHVYRSFMMREGRWHDVHITKSERIPRTLLARLHQSVRLNDGETVLMDVEDERAQLMLHAVEYSDLLLLVFRLPDRLKAVILLIFWEGRSEKDVARVLRISDRTVRNRIHEALKLLRNFLHVEGERCDE